MSEHAPSLHTSQERLHVRPSRVPQLPQLTQVERRHQVRGISATSSCATPPRSWRGVTRLGRRGGGGGSEQCTWLGHATPSAHEAQQAQPSCLGTGLQHLQLVHGHTVDVHALLPQRCRRHDLDRPPRPAFHTHPPEGPQLGTTRRRRQRLCWLCWRCVWHGRGCGLDARPTRCCRRLRRWHAGDCATGWRAIGGGTRAATALERPALHRHCLVAGLAGPSIALK